MGAYSTPPALPTCLLLTHVALCQHVRGMIARTRYINVLTYLHQYKVVQILVLIGLLKCTKFDQLILRKIIEIVATSCQILTLKCTKINFSCDSAPNPAGGAYSAPPDPLAGFKGLYF